MQIIFNIIISYLIGSISGSMVLGYLKGVDIRKMGSGNAGGTNAFRTVGALFALGVIFIDILKGVIAVLLISKLNFINYYSLNCSMELVEVLCAIAAVMGHVYPIYYNFKGGKGAGTLIGIIGVLFPQCIIYALLSWFVTLVFTGFVGLGTMIAGVTLALSAYLSNVPNTYFYFSILMSLFIIFTHRSNIQRMINGDENRFEKIMFFKHFF
tara:strand:- start:1616 stop:2248 length:633 start_codon:yes stop_codon:yes gene_type:complete